MIYRGLIEMLQAIEQKEAMLRKLDVMRDEKRTNFGSILEASIDAEYDKLDKELATLKHDFVMLAVSEFEVHL